MNSALAIRMDLRRAEGLARAIVTEFGLNIRSARTLSQFMVAEARDLRTRELRRVIGKRRASVYILRRRWAERCDANPALESAIYDAVEELKAWRPAQ